MSLEEEHAFPCQGAELGVSASRPPLGQHPGYWFNWRLYSRHEGADSEAEPDPPRALGSGRISPHTAVHACGMAGPGPWGGHRLREVWEGGQC